MQTASPLLFQIDDEGPPCLFFIFIIYVILTPLHLSHSLLQILMTWYRIDFEGESMSGCLSLISRFPKFYVRLPFHPGFALFKLNEESSDKATYFLPPIAASKCAEILIDFEAVRCPQPLRSDLTTAVGMGDELGYWYGDIPRTPPID